MMRFLYFVLVLLITAGVCKVLDIPSDFYGMILAAVAMGVFLVFYCIDQNNDKEE